MCWSVRIGDFVQVLKHREVDVVISEEDESTVWKEDICFPTELGIGIRYFFHPEFLGPNIEAELALKQADVFP